MEDLAACGALEVLDLGGEAFGPGALQALRRHRRLRRLKLLLTDVQFGEPEQLPPSKAAGRAAQLQQLALQGPPGEVRRRAARAGLAWACRPGAAAAVPAAPSPPHPSPPCRPARLAAPQEVLPQLVQLEVSLRSSRLLGAVMSAAAQCSRLSSLSVCYFCSSEPFTLLAGAEALAAGPAAASLEEISIQGPQDNTLPLAGLLPLFGDSFERLRCIRAQHSGFRDVKVPQGGPSQPCSSGGSSSSSGDSSGGGSSSGSSPLLLQAPGCRQQPGEVPRDEQAEQLFTAQLARTAAAVGQAMRAAGLQVGGCWAQGGSQSSHIQVLVHQAGGRQVEGKLCIRDSYDA